MTADDLAVLLQEALWQRQSDGLFVPPRQVAEWGVGAPRLREWQPPAEQRRPCTTGKARFDTPGKAHAALRYIHEHPDPARLYEPTAVTPRCRKCEGYHLTSNSQKVWGKTKTPKQKGLQ